MSRRAIERDVDTIILDILMSSPQGLSPKELSRRVQSKDVSRPTYFRHKEKLLRQMRIEEVTVTEDDMLHRRLRWVTPGLVAVAQDIDLYLEQMENPVKEIRERGYRSFESLCARHKVAWYFHPKHSPHFRNKREVTAFFKEKLKKKGSGRLELLNAISHMLENEMGETVWKKNLIESCQKLVEELVWEREEINVGVRAFQILNGFPDRPMHELGLRLLVESDDHVYGHFESELKKVLLQSPAISKYIIRRRLDEISAASERLRPRIENLLKNASV